jgi:hypothetical protein
MLKWETVVSCQFTILPLSTKLPSSGDCQWLTGRSMKFILEVTTLYTNFQPNMFDINLKNNHEQDSGIYVKKLKSLLDYNISFKEKRHFFRQKSQKFAILTSTPDTSNRLQDYFGSQPDVGKQPIAMVATSTLPERKKPEARSCHDDEDIYEEIEEFPKPQQNGAKFDSRGGLYKFSAADSCLAEDDDDEGSILRNSVSDRKVFGQIFTIVNVARKIFH